MNATTVTPAPASIARIIWDGLRKKPAIATLFGMAVLVWTVSAWMFLSGSMAFRKEGLSRMAFPMMMSAWIAGLMLFSFAQVVGGSSKWQTGAVEQYRRRRFQRWLGSPEATFVDISGAAHERARRTAEARASAQQPDATVIAVPVLTVLGAACLGFAGAMALAERFGGPRSLSLDAPNADAVFWGATLLFFLLLSLAGVGSASLRVYSWATERAEAAARATAAVERARLGALQAQMNPHFLFNTLNTVAALAGPHSSRAERVVEHLSAVLRQSLQRADRPFTAVADELQFVRQYLDVEGERLGARLRVTWDVDADTSPLRVPTMCLLPLVENAIAHAIETRPDGGHIHISSALAADGYLVRLSVEDNGPGFPANVADGRGLSELRQRLWAEYDRRYTLDTETLPTGARVTLSVPATRFDAPADTRRVGEES